MVFFLPIGDVNPTQRTPVVNYALLAANVAVFLTLGLDPRYEMVVRDHGFTPARPELLDAFTAMFLHAGWGHLGGNLLFLWIVGDNVEDKLGHFGYLALYLAAGLAAIAAHWAIEPESAVPCVGASGAIAGALGAYVFLFPHSRIRIWWVIGIGIVRTGVSEVTALWAIGFWFVEQLLMQLYAWRAGMMTGVAYAAHVGGFGFGLGIVFLLCRSGWVERARAPAAVVPAPFSRSPRPRPERSPWNRDEW
jgi:membrane associated rhomboid family serine protease